MILEQEILIFNQYFSLKRATKGINKSSIGMNDAHSYFVIILFASNQKFQIPYERIKFSSLPFFCHDIINIAPKNPFNKHSFQFLNEFKKKKFEPNFEL